MYYTKSPGTGGKTETEDDFIVEEIQNFPKFLRTRQGIKPMSGPYTLFLLTKRNMTTEEAVKFLEKKFGPVGYAGLKDKFAVTSQYVTIKGGRNIKTKNLQLKKIGSLNRPIQVGELIGNKFRITLKNCKHPENMEKLAKELKIMPNYFGPQRFSRSNIETGKKILKRKVRIDKKRAKFLINAYQSRIFNSVLSEYVRKHGRPTFGKFPIPGFGTKLRSSFADKETKKLLKAEGIKLKDFQISESRLCCDGSERHAFVKVKSLTYKINGNIIVMEFELPKGSYATVLIKEVTKNQKITQGF